MGMAEIHPWLKVELRATHTAYSIAAILGLDCAADKYTAGRVTPNRLPPRGNEERFTLSIVLFMTKVLQYQGISERTGNV